MPFPIRVRIPTVVAFPEPMNSDFVVGTLIKYFKKIVAEQGNNETEKIKFLKYIRRNGTPTRPILSRQPT